MLLALATLFGSGLLHGVGPDHCLAIGALATGEGGLRRAVGVSVRFGVGHTLVLALAALAATLAGFAVPARWEAVLEAVGGAALLAIGCWTVFSSRGLTLHRHAHAHGDATHAHVHAHVGGDGGHEHHGTVAALAGAVFGLSGVRSLVLLLPLVLGRRVELVLAGVALFGVGVVLSMVAVGWLTRLVAGVAGRVERGLQTLVGVASMLVGAYWVVSHVG